MTLVIPKLVYKIIITKEQVRCCKKKVIIPFLRKFMIPKAIT